MRRFALALLPLAAACTAPRPIVAPEPVLAPAAALAPAAPREVGMRASLPARLDSIIRAALADGTAPAIAVAVGRHGRLVHMGSYGRIDRPLGSPAVDDSTLFDMASLTKVIATTSVAMRMEEDSALDLDRTVASYLPEFSDSAKAGITVRMLLTHTGGLESGAPLHRQGYRGREQFLQQISQRPLKHAPGTQTLYSDWDLVLAQLVMERLTGKTLDVLAEEQVFRPLGMRETRYRPDASLRPRIAATEVAADRGGLIWGDVHDANAWAMGGVAGHAGLFSSIRDLAVFAQMLLNNGEYNGVRIFRPQTVARWTAPQGRGASRALGWDTPSDRSSAGHFFGPRSFGHTGYTGTSLWMDPERGVFVVLLTNRVNPTADNQKHVALRRAVADAVQQSITDAPLVDWEARRQPQR
ncbi:MAG: beta-lactamase family protein [Gemmatimonadetes bacterium]|nr:beta-lactamase family protein [Gemmatimonadota bacterium]